MESKLTTSLKSLLSAQRLDKKYVVLSLDGGGVRGLMTVEILVEIEDHLRKSLGNPHLKITDVVDCVIGTSAGGLIACALASGKSANELKVLMPQIIGNTFKNPKSMRKRLREAAYDHKNLESELIEKLGADKVTLGQLKERNPNLRLCITALLYDPNGKAGKFTPVVFDSENEADKNRTLLSVGRATSAAPTYFEGSKMEDGKVYFDGGCFANDPSSWGVILASTKVKLDSIRLVSVGTGYADPEPQQTKPPEEDDEGGFLDSCWNGLSSYVKSTKDYLLTAASFKDNGGDKKGISDWVNAELIGSLIFDVQKQVEEIMKIMKPGMENHFWRLNPKTDKEFKLDNADEDSQRQMSAAVQKYIHQEATQAAIRDLTSTLSQPDDFEAKALKYLMKAANMIEFSLQHRNSENQKRARKAAKLLKVMQTHYQEAVEKVTDDEILKEKAGIETFINLQSNKKKSEVYKTVIRKQLKTDTQNAQENTQ